MKGSEAFDFAMDKVAEFFEELDGRIIAELAVYVKATSDVETEIVEKVREERNRSLKECSAQETNVMHHHRAMNRITTPQKDSASSQHSPCALSSIFTYNTLKSCIPTDGKKYSVPLGSYPIHLILNLQSSFSRGVACIDDWLRMGFRPVRRSIDTINNPIKVLDCAEVAQAHNETPAGSFLKEAESANILVRNGVVFYGAWGISIHPATGNLYVSSYSGHQIKILSPDLDSLGFLGDARGVSNDTQISKVPAGSQKGQLNFPVAVVFGRDGSLLVSEHMNHRIQKFSGDGASVWVVGGLGSQEGQFCNHYGVAMDLEGNCYVSDWGNERIQKFNKDGVFVCLIGQRGSTNPARKSDALLITHSNTLVSVAIGGSLANEYALDGTHIASYEIAEVRGYNYLCHGPNMGFVLCDRDGNNIRFYSRRFELTKQITVPSPSGLAFGFDGRLYVTSMNNFIYVF